MPERMPLATKKRALLLGAGFIEHDLDLLRQGLRRRYDEVRSRQPEQKDYSSPLPPEQNPDLHPPISTSHEADAMKAAEWASAATWLRALAEREDA